MDKKGWVKIRLKNLAIYNVDNILFGGKGISFYSQEKEHVFIPYENIEFIKSNYILTNGIYINPNPLTKEEVEAL
jgi:hypothetical protein